MNLSFIKGWHKAIVEHFSYIEFKTFCYKILYFVIKVNQLAIKQLYLPFNLVLVQHNILKCTEKCFLNLVFVLNYSINCIENKIIIHLKHIVFLISKHYAKLILMNHDWKYSLIYFGGLSLHTPCDINNFNFFFNFLYLKQVKLI